VALYRVTAFPYNCFTRKKRSVQGAKIHKYCVAETQCDWVASTEKRREVQNILESMLQLADIQTGPDTLHKCYFQNCDKEIRARCQFVPDRCVPELNFLNVHPAGDASLGNNPPLVCCPGSGNIGGDASSKGWNVQELYFRETSSRHGNKQRTHKKGDASKHLQAASE
jgi:hypothetical protein